MTEKEKEERFEQIAQILHIASGIAFIPISVISIIGFGLRLDYQDKKIEEILKNQKIEIPHAEYVNNDSLIDLVYSNKKTYLQTPEGTFVMYDKTKVDSLYKLKENSIKTKYESELQKKLKEVSKEKESFLEKVAK